MSRSYRLRKGKHMDTKRLKKTISVHPMLWGKVEVLAKEDSRSASRFVERAIFYYLESRSTPPRRGKKCTGS